MERFIVDGRYGAFLATAGVDVTDALRRAQLPEDLFDTDRPIMSEEQYYHFFETLGGDAELAVRLACAEGVEQFSPAIYGAYCSSNGRIFLQRLARYKKLIGPLTFELQDETQSTRLRVRASRADLAPPAFLVLLELAFVLHAMREATGKPIAPMTVHVRELLAGDVRGFFGVPLVAGSSDQMQLSNTDLEIPFQSSSTSIWDYLEPEMSRKLEELGAGSTARESVRTLLPEMLLAGSADEQGVADVLGMSTRTLQRRLHEEGTTFKHELQSVRESLALRYLRDPRLSYGTISQLLGYQERNSFLRAFTSWTGMSASAFRRKLAEEAGE